MEKDFKFLFKIGRGAFGKVWKVQFLKTQMYFSMKIMNKRK